jgi:MFS family permease
MCNTLALGAFFWSFNGAGLALLIPNAQSLIADYFKPVSRGTAFGALYLTGAVGGMLGALFATNLGGMKFHSLEGWRVAFLIVALASALVGLLNYFYSVDPRYKAEHPQYVQDPDIYKQQPVSLARMGADILSVISVPSFILVIAQGIIGSTPWNGLVFNTLYLQLLGFSDFHASLISSLFLGGTAIGGLIGGILGDVSSSISPNHGRVLVAQFSVGIGVPMAAVVYKLLPTGSSDEAPPLLLYCAAFLTFGALVSWAAPACTSPIFADVVPSQQRSLVFSFDRAFEGAVASMGAPIVGWLAERFGFSTHSKSDPGPDLDSAAALGDAMLLCTAIPWAVCALMFSGLHITYQRDRKAAIAYQRARSGFATGSYSLLQPIPEGDGDGDDDGEGGSSERAGGAGNTTDLDSIGSYRMPMPQNNRRGPIGPRRTGLSGGGGTTVSRSL